MTKKLQSQLKKAELKRLSDERTALSRCVTKKTLGVRIKGIQI